MKNYYTFEEFERDRDLATMRGFAIAGFFSTLIWALFFLVSCHSCAHAAEIDMQRIAMIESSGNPLAHNKTDDSIGLYQITPIVLKEYNNFHPKNSYTRTDLWNPAVNYRIADWYMNVRIPQMLKHFGLPDTIENRIISYNAGIGNAVKGRVPPITKKYIDKYQRYAKGAR